MRQELLSLEALLEALRDGVTVKIESTFPLKFSACVNMDMDSKGSIRPCFAMPGNNAKWFIGKYTFNKNNRIYALV